jgi:hypothetical protein
MVDRSDGVGLLVGFIAGIGAFAAPHAVMAQEAGPQPAPASSTHRSDSPESGNGNADTTQPEFQRGFWASFAHSMPLGLSTRTPGEGGL